MRFRRLGNFKFGDYLISWISMVIMLLFSTVSIVLELPLWLVIIPLVYVIIWLAVILVPHCEQFSINSSTIYVFWGQAEKTIVLPNELTLILSYADVCPPLAVLTPFGKETHILKDKVFVSILQNMPANYILDALHRSRIQKHTASSIRRIFNDYYIIYSFVCDQFLFDALTDNRRCSVIVPESLSKVLSFDYIAENVYIDYGH